MNRYRWNPIQLIVAVLNMEDRVCTIERKLVHVMTDQEHLDADVAQLQSATTAIEAEVAALKAANPGVDFTGLDAAVAQLNTDVPPAAPSA